MRQRIGLLTLLVADDDEAIAYDSEKRGGARGGHFDPCDEAPGRRGSAGRDRESGLLLAEAADEAQRRARKEKIRTLDPRFVVWGHTSGSGQLRRSGRAPAISALPR
jgi:hypothetical protein